MDPSTGDGVCVSSCDVDNGGCPSNEVCVVKEYGIECFKPPHGNVFVIVYCIVVNDFCVGW